MGGGFFGVNAAVALDFFVDADEGGKGKSEALDRAGWAEEAPGADPGPLPALSLRACACAAA